MRPNPTPPFTRDEIQYMIGAGLWTPQVAQAHAAAGGIPKPSGGGDSGAQAAGAIGGPIAQVGGSLAGPYLANQAASALGLTPAAASGAASGSAAAGASMAPFSTELFNPAAVNAALSNAGTATGSAVGTSAASGLNAGAGSGGASLGGTISSAAPYLGAAGAALSAYNLADNFGDMSNQQGALSGAGLGAGLGMAAPLLGFAALGPVGLLAAAALGAGGGLGLAQFTTGKHPEQKDRDLMRNAFEEAGLLSKDQNTGSHLVGLAGGGAFDVGRDDDTPYYNVGYGTPGYVGWEDLQRGTATPADVDAYITENFGQTVGAIDPLMGAMTGYDPKLRSDFTGYLTNAAHSSGNPMANVRGFYEQAGFDRDKIYGATVDAYNRGELDAQTADAYRAAIDRVFGVTNPNQGKGGAAEGFFYQPQQPQQQTQLPTDLDLNSLDISQYLRGGRGAYY